MDGVGAGLDRDADHIVDVEVGGDRPLALADLVGLVGLEAMEGELVLLGEDGDGADAQLVRRAEDANGDLGTVGNQDLLDRHARFSPGNAGNRPYLAGLCACEKGLLQVRTKPVVEG